MITIENRNKITERAKNKADGCYRAFCIAYRVRNGGVTHMANCGDIFECHGVFNVKVGEYDSNGINSDELGQKILKKIKD